MEINPLANIMAYTVVMDVLVFSKEVFENVSSIPVYVSIIWRPPPQIMYNLIDAESELYRPKVNSKMYVGRQTHCFFPLKLSCTWSSPDNTWNISSFWRVETMIPLFKNYLLIYGYFWWDRSEYLLLHANIVGMYFVIR